jgi:hypothetical protein
MIKKSKKKVYLKYCLAGDSLFKGQVKLAVDKQHLLSLSLNYMKEKYTIYIKNYFI